ncbi:MULTISPECIES: YdeI/OmpD-associated family protein [unclassified Paenibacillus]|uniref:YdeI/OmpD-associated family protein n=1 Tax=unclassified Paenibacillus TaxID=185978 RepID=UPI0008391F02|nr:MULTISPECIES: YdeI/OmpD-associated family protein [unclassified Paenibacillus]NWL87911.1 bacteriocin-protection protein [Paenibacillus sp. 79R4]
MAKNNDLPIMAFSGQQDFEAWLAQNHDTSAGIMLKIAKKNSTISTVSYSEALDCALCYGWIDSRKEKADEETWLQRFTPRKASSIWSQVNKERTEALIASGRMKPSGYQAIEAAKQNGRWDNAYESQSKSTLPEDFVNELNKNHQAKQFYDGLDSRNKFAIVFRINNAKKQETRQKRIDQFILMLERQEKIYP